MTVPKAQLNDHQQRRTLTPEQGRKSVRGPAAVSQANLRERVKELTCLYGIAQIASTFDLSLKSKLAAIVRLLPPAWQYPERACARITIDGQAFPTPNFREGACRQTANICIAEKKRGAVEIHYPDDRGMIGKTPFLTEEQNLIDNIAGQISLMIEHEEARTAKAELQKQLIKADRLAAIGQLAAGVAHELNEPLNAILGFAQLTQKSPELPAQARKDIERITDAALHARNIIRELLIFARQGKPGSTQVNLTRIIMEDLNLFAPLCEKAGVELRRIVAPDLPEITANKSQIRQVISNLIVNALQAMPGGGILMLQTSFDATSVRLRVDDTGIGIKDELKDSIFLPFFSTKDVDQGTGLGLSVAHGIVSSHGGEICIENKTGKGACFCVTFPRHPETVTREESL